MGAQVCVRLAGVTEHVPGRIQENVFLTFVCLFTSTGHGGAGVAQSLAEHVPGRIQDNVLQIIEFGPQHVSFLSSRMCNCLYVFGLLV